jgi:PPM family protein phosphatase
MTVKCPTCGKDFAADEAKCTACGTARPVSVPARQTTVLNQGGTAVADAPELNQFSNTGWGNNQPPTPAPSFAGVPAAKPKPTAEDLTAAIEAAEKEKAPEVVAGTAIAEPETPSAAPAPAPEYPTFWKCENCVTLNPSSEQYCENCGAPAPTTQRVELKGNYYTKTPAATEAVPRSPGVNDTADLSEMTTDKISSDLVAALAAETLVEKPKVLRLFSDSATDVGLSRKGMANEDSLFTLETQRYFEGNLENFGLYIVADGMGGQAAGEVASKIAIQTVSQMIATEITLKWLSGTQLDHAIIEETLSNAVHLAHMSIRDYNQYNGVDAGTTMTTCVVTGGHAVFANVGDSRTYLFRPVVEEPPAPVAPAPPNPAASDDEEKTDPTLPVVPRSDPEQEVHKPLSDRVTVKMKTVEKETDKLDPAKVVEPKPKFIVERVTKDQSLVQQLVDSGELKIDEVYSDPRRNVILYALGAPEPDVPVDTYHRNLQDGDIILLCSDGLWEMIRDKQIVEQIDLHRNLHECAQNLVALANQNGGADNIAVVIVRAEYD